MENEKVKEIKELLLRKAKEYESQTLLDILSLINEFEKENAKYNQKLTTNQWVQEIRKEALKQFAERLKDKVKNFCGTEEENHYYDVSKEGACEEIDETLKDFDINPV